MGEIQYVHEEKNWENLAAVIWDVAAEGFSLIALLFLWKTFFQLLKFFSSDQN